MRNWTEFFPDVLPHVLGCPEPTVELHLLRAAREFCRRTRCWRATLPTITTTTAAEYTISYPSQADGVQFIGATYGGKDIKLEVADGTTLEERLAGSAWPRRILTTDMRTITVIPTPAAGVVVALSAILQPSETAAGVPNDIGDRYRGEIAHGALATLLTINKAEWANATLGGIHQAAFTAAIADTQTRVWKAFTNARPRSVGCYY